MVTAAASAPGNGSSTNGQNSSSSSPSSSPSPPHSPRLPRCRRQPSIPPRRPRRSSGSSTKTTAATTFLYAIPAVIRRCLRYWLVIPLLYVSGLVICICPISGFFRNSPPPPPPPPGSVYRSEEVFRAVWSDMQRDNDNSTGIKISSVWRYKKPPKLPTTPTRDDNQRLGQPWCTAISINNRHNDNNDTAAAAAADDDGSVQERRPLYLIVEANGGLNQQRASICNAVVVAGLLNATLVIPHFNYHSVWMDPSEFGDIYDTDHFIATLNKSIDVVRDLPPLSSFSIFNNSSNISGSSSNISSSNVVVPATRVPAWATIQYYLDQINPILQRQGVIRIAPFANRLAMNIPPKYQHLRCLANYKALKFASPISTLANELVKRLVEKSSDGKYVSVHLRFEEDMVAFSCCQYGGGRKETTLMESIRKQGWKGKFEKRRRDQAMDDPGVNRMSGKCPLTPVEVGMLLRAMGFDNTTTIYLASGKLYQPEKHLSPLHQMFPLLHTKESLTAPAELAPLRNYSSRLAAVDYAVCLASEVFVTTQGGNFPMFLMGHRRFLYGGHAKTVKPNKVKLARLFHNATAVRWGDVKREAKMMLDESDREGMMMTTTTMMSDGKRRRRMNKSRRRNSVYQYPFPECECVHHDGETTSTTTG